MSIDIEVGKLIRKLRQADYSDEQIAWHFQKCIHCLIERDIERERPYEI